MENKWPLHPFTPLPALITSSARRYWLGLISLVKMLIKQQKGFFFNQFLLPLTIWNLEYLENCRTTYQIFKPASAVFQRKKTYTQDKQYMCKHVHLFQMFLIIWIFLHICHLPLGLLIGQSAHIKENNHGPDSSWRNKFS